MVTLSPTRPEGGRSYSFMVCGKRQPCPLHALKGQKLLAQGNALGCFGRLPVAL